MIPPLAAPAITLQTTTMSATTLLTDPDVWGVVLRRCLGQSGRARRDPDGGGRRHREPRSLIRRPSPRTLALLKASQSAQRCYCAPDFFFAPADCLASN